MIDSIINQQQKFLDRNGGLAGPDPKDPRDYNALELMGAPIEIPSFEQGFNALDGVWPDMPNSDQGQQFSCVGRGWAHYKQVLQAADTGEKTVLSAKSIYNPIAIPRQGAYVRNGALRTVDYGVNKESTVPSSGTEAEVTAKMSFEPFKEEASFFKNSVVAVADTQDFDTLARLIFQNRGFVSGWQAHCQYFKEYGIIDGKRYLKTHNSYGPGSDMYFFEGMGERLFSIWTAVDVKNMPQLHKIRLIRTANSQNVYFVLGGKRYLVFNPSMMQDGLSEGIWDGFSAVEIIPELDMKQIPLVKISFSDFMKLWVA